MFAQICKIGQIGLHDVNLYRNKAFRCFHISYPLKSFTKIPVDDKRDIGIIAHIDAGKTTTTERLLYYTQNKSSIGNVDEGNTTTDFLKEERARGITIQSACISIFYKNKMINIIDTPGHADFNYEVIKSLKILDGAVLILDSAMGVETQTLKVFKQAKMLPKVCYINKMDKMGHNFNKCIKDIMVKLNNKPVILTYPIFSLDTIGLSKDDEMDKDNSYLLDEKDREDLSVNDKFVGVLDILNKCACIYKPMDPDYIKIYKYEELNEVLKKKLSHGRNALIESLTTLDSNLLDYILEAGIEDYVLDKNLTAKVINECIRKLTIEKLIIPVVCGSSFQNVGVQSLIQAILNYLPSPGDACDYPELQYNNVKVPIKYDAERKFMTVFDKKDISIGQVFKIIKYPSLGNLLFFRVYAGSFKCNTTVINTTKYHQLLTQLSKTHKKGGSKLSNSQYNIKQLYLMQGNMPIKTNELSVGDIGCIVEKPINEQIKAVTGSDFEEIKNVHTNSLATGDTIVQGNLGGSINIPESIEKVLPKDSKKKKITVESILTGLRISPLEQISRPYKVSIDLLDVSKFRDLVLALLEITKFDPSVDFNYEESTGQIILEGFGELQLEVIIKRLLDEAKGTDPGYGFRNLLSVSDINVSYKEALKPMREIENWFSIENAETMADTSTSNLLTEIGMKFKIKRLNDYSEEPISKELSELSSQGYHTINVLENQDCNYIAIEQSIINEWPEYRELTLDQFLACVKAACLSIIAQRNQASSYPLMSTLFMISGEDFKISNDFKDLSGLTKCLRTSYLSALENNFKEKDYETLEPFVQGEVTTIDRYTNAISHDLTAKESAVIEYIGSSLESDENLSQELSIHDTRKEIESYNKMLYVPRYEVGSPDVTIDVLSADSNISNDNRKTGESRVIKFKAPLKKMSGYLSNLRSISQGNCSLDLKIIGYRRMNSP